VNTLAMVETACALCGSTESDVIVVGCDRDHDLDGAFPVVRCRRCAHHRLDPRPADSELGRLYPDDYVPFAVETGTSDSLRARVRARLEDLVHFGPYRTAPAERLLEVGCGNGRMLQRYASRGWEVRGVEPSASASEVARRRGFDVITGTDTELDDMEAATFDAVHAFMVVEHTPDPVRTLRRFRRVATPDAVLRISVPNFSHRSRRRFGDCWYSLHLPRHYQHFSPESITEALRQSGWQVTRIWHQPTNVDVWRSIDLQRTAGADVDRLAAVRPASRLIDLATLPIRFVLAQFVGSSRMTIVAAVDPSAPPATE